MNENQVLVYKLAVSHFGILNQMVKTMEETGELTQALSKVILKTNPGFDNIIEELADVQIMIHQMSLYFGIENFRQRVVDKTTNLSLRIGLAMAAAEKNGPQVGASTS